MEIEHQATLCFIRELFLGDAIENCLSEGNQIVAVELLHVRLVIVGIINRFNLELCSQGTVELQCRGIVHSHVSSPPFQSETAGAASSGS